MKLVKYLMPLFMAAGFTSVEIFAQAIGQETAFDRQLRERDDQPLREFVESKENIDVKKKANNLDISGDVRFEWRTIQEKGIALYSDESSGYGSEEGTSSSFHEKYRGLRGGHYVDTRGIPISHNDFDVEFNLKVKYSFDRAWAMAHVQYDNPAGIRGRNPCFDTFVIFNEDGSEIEEVIPRDLRRSGKGSGDASAINLKRAYIGYNIWADGKHRLDIEIGRRKMDDIFDSEVQFSSRFDGIILKFASAIDEIADWYCTAGAFVIDERVNHFGWATEVGVLNVFDTGLDIKYSFIDWQKRGKNRCFIRNSAGTRFQNSQITLTYRISPEIYCQKIPFEFYSGFLINHAAKKSVFTHHKKKNLAAYAGLYVGEVNKKGDWALDIEYIYVQAQAVSDFDVGSIGRGNILDENLTDIIDEQFLSSVSSSSYYDSIPTSALIGYFPRRGNANFKGWRFEFLYAITDNFSIDTIYEFSNAEDRKIGGPHHYCDFELEAIYAF